jgi:hypothetical protein
MTVLIFVWTVTSVQAFETITREMVEKQIVTETDLIRNVDNFIILFDTSSSANKMVAGKNVSMIQAAKNLLKERNACSQVVPLNAFLDNPTYIGGAVFMVKTTVYERLVPVTEVVGIVADDVLFDFNSADLQPEHGEK